MLQINVDIDRESVHNERYYVDQVFLAIVNFHLLIHDTRT